jgi:hypothetical protein
VPGAVVGAAATEVEVAGADVTAVAAAGVVAALSLPSPPHAANATTASPAAAMARTLSTGVLISFSFLLGGFTGCYATGPTFGCTRRPIVLEDVDCRWQPNSPERDPDDTTDATDPRSGGMTLNRSAELGDFVGRTLDRRASRYDVPSRVTDDGWKSSYYDN